MDLKLWALCTIPYIIFNISVCAWFEHDAQASGAPLSKQERWMTRSILWVCGLWMVVVIFAWALGDRIVWNLRRLPWWRVHKRLIPWHWYRYRHTLFWTLVLYVMIMINEGILYIVGLAIINHTPWRYENTAVVIFVVLSAAYLSNKFYDWIRK